MSSAESSCTKVSFSILASTSAIGCSNSRNVVFIGSAYDTAIARGARRPPQLGPRFAGPARIVGRLRSAAAGVLEHRLHVAPKAPAFAQLVPARFHVPY